jgi:hypothetical protein
MSTSEYQIRMSQCLLLQLSWSSIKACHTSLGEFLLLQPDSLKLGAETGIKKILERQAGSSTGAKLLACITDYKGIVTAESGGKEPTDIGGW